MPVELPLFFEVADQFEFFERDTRGQKLKLTNPFSHPVVALRTQCERVEFCCAVSTFPWAPALKQFLRPVVSPYSLPYRMGSMRLGAANPLTNYQADHKQDSPSPLSGARGPNPARDSDAARQRCPSFFWSGRSSPPCPS